MVRKLSSEALGTALLVFFGVGVATLSFGFGFGTAGPASFAVGVVATAMAFGLALLAMAYVLGPVSGCHVNPAVTMGFLVARRIGMAQAVGYWIAQLTGGVLGALLLWGVFSTSPLYHRSTTGLAANGWGFASHVHIGAGGAFLAEAVLAAVFVFVFLGATTKASNPLVFGLTIGLTLTVVHLIGIPLTGTSVNPARSLGPAVVVGGAALNQVWLFLFAPLVGGAVAAGLHLALFPSAETSPKSDKGSPGPTPEPPAAPLGDSRDAPAHVMADDRSVRGTVLMASGGAVPALGTRSTALVVSDPEQILITRLAQGDLEIEEYERLLALIRRPR